MFEFKNLVICDNVISAEKYANSFGYNFQIQNDMTRKGFFKCSCGQAQVVGFENPKDYKETYIAVCENCGVNL